jgi:crotonobetainyl-CoA:carnitine CoA-transferase CaiB-like acyl-CoA transferase
MAKRYHPLRGVRVLSFEAAFSLPAATRILAELGAEVVRIARPTGDFPPYTHQTDGSGINKRSVAIDLGNEAGRELGRRFVARADVVANNFRPGVMARYGLDYDGLRTIRADIISLQLSGYGVPGPWQSFPAYRPSVEAAAGMNASIGGAADPPMRVGSGVFADQTAARYAALAVLMALVQRRLTGEGRHIDLSMYAGIVHLLGDRVLEAASLGHAPHRMGNRDVSLAPQGVYPCAGEDEWLAVTVANDAQWHSLRTLIDDPRLGGAALDLAGGRVERHDLIDTVIADWTRQQTKEEAASTLQALGIAAGPVEKASNLPFDAQLRFRGAFQPVEHEQTVLGYGAHPQLTLAWQVVGATRPRLSDAPVEGADNLRVLRRWLGVPAAEVRRLERSGALLRPQRAEVRHPSRPAGTPHDSDFARRLGLQAEDASP